MPELPDITAYIRALEKRILGQPLERLRLGSPFLLRTVDPPLSSAVGQRVARLRRIGKRIAIGFENDIWLVLHLMIAGRLHWSPRYKIPDGRRTLAAFGFDSGCLTLTEAGSQKRARLYWSEVHLLPRRPGVAQRGKPWPTPFSPAVPLDREPHP